MVWIESFPNVKVKLRKVHLCILWHQIRFVKLYIFIIRHSCPFDPSTLCVRCYFFLFIENYSWVLLHILKLICKVCSTGIIFSNSYGSLLNWHSHSHLLKKNWKKHPHTVDFLQLLLEVLEWREYINSLYKENGPFVLSDSSFLLLPCYNCFFLHIGSFKTIHNTVPWRLLK